MQAIGVNGADVYTEKGVGDARVSLFTMLNRDLDPAYIKEYTLQIYQEHHADMWALAFQTRDIRGGKGERELFYIMMAILNELDANITAKMLDLVPEYGSWRDMLELWKRIPSLKSQIVFRLVHQCVNDRIAYQSRKPLSLLAKWLPREKSKAYRGYARVLAKELFPDTPDYMRVYRMMCSAYNKELKTVEVNMCSKTWANIEPNNVPGRTMKINDAAFLNEQGYTLRYPDDTDRMACRAHFQTFLEDVKNGKSAMKGANVIMPHELVVKAARTRDQADILQSQWDSIREAAKKEGGLTKAVAMCDFSGSMTGLPMEISKALGILISELTHPAFRDHILTFDAVPKWHTFTGTLKEKLETLANCGQGLNTDFYAACRLILDRMIAAKVPVEDAPEDLIVLTDMGFDAAHTEKEWDPLMERIRREFADAGYTPPRIVIWNLRAEFRDFHATADQEGVVQLSGWSPNMFKVLQKGISVITPYEGLRAVLDHPRYDKVRALYAHAAFNLL